MKKLLLLLVILIASRTAEANDCRSMLAGYIKPLYDSSALSWAAEATFSKSWLDVKNNTNAMLLLGVNYNIAGSSRHSIYLEGGGKLWATSAPGPGSILGGQSEGYESSKKKLKNRLNFREAFYKYFEQNIDFTAGLQTMSLGDYFLLDERVIGISHKQNINNFRLQASFGTVVNDVSRMGDFCGVKHTYNIIHDKDYDFTGDHFGESNLFGVVLAYKPQKETSELRATDEDEFEEFQTSEKSGKKLINEVGGLFYTEFGSVFTQYKHYAGGLATFNLPLDIELKAEAVAQFTPDTKAIGYFLRGVKNLLWNNGDITTLNLSYYGVETLDVHSAFYPSFSNLFLGEVLRMDAINLPIVFAYIKHSFASPYQFSVKAQFAEQLGGNFPPLTNSGEIDLELSGKFFRHFKPYLIFSRIHSELLDKTYYMAKFELRTAI